MRKRIFSIIQIGNKEDFPSRFFDIFITIVIFANILTMFLETFSQLAPVMQILKAIEYGSTLIFCGEYLLRIWTADFLYPRMGKLKSRLRFLISYDGIVDLLTIIPAFFLSGFVVFRLLRVVRIFHLFRLNAQYDSFNIITTVLREKKNQIISSVFIILILMFASSLGVYSVEHQAQPEVFCNAFSGIWWSMATLLTVGYGDIYPVTVLGRIMAILTAFLGVGVVAIPTGIISAGFVELYTRKEHDGTKFPDTDQIGEVRVDGKHHLLGKTVGEIYEQYTMRIIVILREDMTILPRENLTIRKNDLLIVESDKLTRGEKNGK